ncbi:hypothetical protein, partial [Cognatishimia maritima]
MPTYSELINGTTYHDLSTRYGDEAEINGALFLTQSPETSAGTGLIQAFVRVQADGDEDGFNTDDRPLQNDENSSPSFTKSLTLDQVPIIEIDGVEYYEFRLDINQKNSDPLLSLDELQVYVSPDDDYGTTLTELQSEADLVYDMDGLGDTSVLLDYSLQAGSGKSDMFFYVPVSNFEAELGENYDASSTYVVLYSEFGTTGELVDTDSDGVGPDEDLSGNYATNDGFEEWSVSKDFEGPMISGYKWNDVDGDGIWDEGEEALSGWKIDYEYTVGNGANAVLVVGTTTTSDGTTDVNGDGILDDVGSYYIPLEGGSNQNYSITITEFQQDGWQVTYDGDGTLDGSTVVSINKNDIPDNVPNGDFEVTEKMNFGNFKNFNITGYKWDDTDGDGVWDAGETGIENWTIYLDSNNDGVADKTTTTD